jgi:hypothetical protein
MNRAALATSSLLVLSLAAVGCAPGEVGTADPTGSNGAELSSSCPPSLPSASLAVPGGNVLDFKAAASGVQIYTCAATGWTFKAPEAELFDNGGELFGHHFAGPTWQALDGSEVVGSKLAAFTVSAASIPWLLLGAASHTGDGKMAKVTFIQRLQTSGGIAPATGCDAAHLGATARVGYTATYYFYKAGSSSSCN